MTLLGIKPGYVPAARAAAWAWLCGDTEEWLRAGPGAGRLKRGQAAEHVRAAELVHVGEALAELVGVAAASLPPYRVRVEDVPAPAGYCVYATPVPVGEDAARVAVWGPRRGGVTVSLWGYEDEGDPGGVDHERDLEEELRAGPLVLVGAAALDVPRRGGRAPVPPAVELDEAARVVVATWLLMAQPRLVIGETERAPRAVRRAVARGGELPPEATVHRVDLRPSPADKDEDEGQGDEDGPRVRGFWRPRRVSPEAGRPRRPWWVTTRA